MHRTLRVVGWAAAVAVAAVVVLWQLPLPVNPNLRWGASFSPTYATYLGLDWRAAFLAARDELGFRRWRLNVPWEVVEPEPGRYDFGEVDWLLNAVAESGGQATLAVGRRTPRWPECHEPAWAEALPAAQQREAILATLAAVVQRYQDHPALAAWQVENEVSLSVFGDCPPPDLSFFEAEVALVRALDSQHPVVTTVSGELSWWGRLARQVDALGTSLYRVTWNPVWGYFHYPYPAAFYRVRAWLTQRRTGTPVYVSELQLEPWGRQPLPSLSLEEQFRSMGLAEIERSLSVARRSGLSPVDLWGVEWWYWLRETYGRPEVWEAVRAAVQAPR